MAMDGPDALADPVPAQPGGANRSYTSLDRSHLIQVVAPGPDHDLSLPETGEDLPFQALVPEFCSEMPASLQARARLMPWASCTSIWRSFAMICSGLNRFPLAISGSFGPGRCSQSTRSKSGRSGQGEIRSTSSRTVRGRVVGRPLAAACNGLAVDLFGRVCASPSCPVRCRPALASSRLGVIL